MANESRLASSQHGYIYANNMSAQTNQKYDVQGISMRQSNQFCGGDMQNALSSPTISDYKPNSILRNPKGATFGRNQKREDSPELSPVNVVSSYDPLR